MNLAQLIPGLHKRRGRNQSKGAEYHGPCPFCGEGDDRFMVWPEVGETGAWHCRRCMKGGDGIEYLRLSEDLSYREACARFQVSPANDYSSTRSIIPPLQTQRKKYSPLEVEESSVLWQEKAAAFAEHSHERLLQTGSQLAWLHQRGIGMEMIEKYKLGWNPTDAWRPRASWGLPKEYKDNGQEKKLWLPTGLVIPWFLNGHIHRLRIRRPQGGLRYYVIPGSGLAKMISRPNARAYLVVESELDAITIDSIAGDIVGTIAMGSNSQKPDNTVWPHLSAALHVSVALDSDAAGAKAATWWLENLPRAERVPIIGGKDPGEAHQNGIDLREWVLAGLPPVFLIKTAGAGIKKISDPSPHDDNSRLARCGEGGGAETSTDNELLELATIMKTTGVMIQKQCFDNGAIEVAIVGNLVAVPQEDAKRLNSLIWGSVEVGQAIDTMPIGTFDHSKIMECVTHESR